MKKQCSKCKRMLDSSKFYKDKGNNDGLCSQCKECRDKYQRERDAGLKLEAINVFGGRCAHVENGIQCPKNSIDDLGDLDLIHPNGDGNAHRALISNGQGGGYFYEALKDRNWNTDGFIVQAMCRSHHNSLDRSGKKHPLYGTSHSKETKAKMRESNTGKKNPMYGKYKDGKFNDPIWLKKKYETMTIEEIAILCGVSRELIRRRLKKFNIQRRKPGRRIKNGSD